MNKKLPRILAPSMRLYFLFLVLFAGASLFFNWILAAVEAGVIFLLLIYSIIAQRHQKRELLQYIENAVYNVDSATKDTLMNFPMPMAIVQLSDGEIVWSNSLFLEITGSRQHTFEVRIGDTVPGFSLKWLLEGQTISPEIVELRDRKYQVFGNIVRSEQQGGGHDFLATTYWMDITDFSNIQDEYEASKLIAGIIMIDNYDEVTKSQSETTRANIRAAIDDKINAWIAGTGSLLCRYDRDKYLFLFEARYLKRFIDSKFSILEDVHTVTVPKGLTASLSIGIGRDGESFEQNFQFASLAMEMALSRGGDQVVIKNHFNFEFYGGRSTEVEKRTKVKSRVIANSLRELMQDVNQVFIIGHRFPDLDCLGAAVGVCCIARKLGKPANIVMNTEHHAISAMVNQIRNMPEYTHSFLSAQDAMLLIDNRSLLVVVDTNRPEQVDYRELLDACNRIAVIDHHRRAATYIDNAVLNFQEPYASSACELVTELMQYLLESSDILRYEAEAVLAGIVLDTKSFTLRTGGRTFDAAAFLRRAGADTSEVKKFMQNDLASTVARYKIVQEARIYKQGIAIAAPDTQEDRIIAAQAADELLNIYGIAASFVLFPEGDTIVISARSIGDINVQVILERLGGGGNKSTAGAQMKNTTLREAVNTLLSSIDVYLEDNQH